MIQRSGEEILDSIEALLLEAEHDLQRAKWALVRAKLAQLKESEYVSRETLST